MALSPERKRQIRKQKFAEQNGRCFWCNERMSLKSTDKHGKVTIEHIEPKAHGGSNRLENLALAHSWCNLLRGREDAEEYGMIFDITLAKVRKGKG